MTEHVRPSGAREPASSSGLLASDEDRERVVERVRAAVADGRPALSELDGRLGQVHEARTFGEPAVAAGGLPEPGPRDSLLVDRAPTSRFALGMFGGFARECGWVAPGRFTAWSMWGGGRIAPSEARFTARETVIRAVALWGGTGIVVPDAIAIAIAIDIAIEVRGFGLFGVFKRRGARKVERPGAPRVVIKGAGPVRCRRHEA
ncbi:DUF1707 domain-containing protein [Streptomyces sp. NPDC101151]|uniref:DUF1707 SHOCT-like domain-containing protein n=1 Tax=Streptomyces sp. NPDC101151 TaxID=3366115 RepID=UPI00382056A7